MNFLGIALRRPGLGEVTAAAVMGIGCWMLATGIAKASGHPMAATDAGALLVVCVWATVGVRLGLRLDQGPRHIGVYAAVAAGLLGLYQAALAIAA